MSILLLFCVAVFIFAKVSNWKYKKSLYEHEDDLPKRRRVKKQNTLKRIMSRHPAIQETRNTLSICTERL